MDFALCDEQLALQATARRFAQDEIAPVAAELDQTAEFPRELIRKAWELGLVSTCIPDEYGGVGLPILEACIAVEELAWGCSGVTTSVMCNDLGLMPIVVGGTEDQKKEWLVPCAADFRLVSFCLSEPNAGSDVAGLQLLAERDGDGYVLNGTKCWITNGGHADLYTVFATMDRSTRHAGVCAFVVPRDTPGLEPGKKEDKMGQRASDTCAVHFDNVKVPASQRLGEEGEGFTIAMKAFDITRPLVASGAVGLARAAFEHACEYARERKTMGKPIFMHQAVSFIIADMAKDIEASRLLVWHSAWTIDQGTRNTKLASMAKCFAADTAHRVASDAVQVFGGNGFNTEYPVEKLLRDSKIFQIYEGTSQIQRLIIAKEIFTR